MRRRFTVSIAVVSATGAVWVVVLVLRGGDPIYLGLAVVWVLSSVTAIDDVRRGGSSGPD